MNPPNVMCLDGCGEYADAGLEYRCTDCYKELVQERKERATEEQEKFNRQEREKLLQSKDCDTAPDGDTNEEISSLGFGKGFFSRAKGIRNKLFRRADKDDELDPKVMGEFLSRSREKDSREIRKEVQTFTQEQKKLRHAQGQLKQYMVASNADVDLNPNTWRTNTLVELKYFEEHDCISDTENNDEQEAEDNAEIERIKDSNLSGNEVSNKVEALLP